MLVVLLESGKKPREYFGISCNEFAENGLVREANAFAGIKIIKIVVHDENSIKQIGQSMGLLQMLK